MPDAMNASPASRTARTKWLLWAAVAVAVLVAMRLLPVQDTLRQALEWLRSLGAWGPVLFVAVYALATVLLVPGSVLTLGAGAVYGVVYGSLIVSLASTLGATAAFLVSRHLARDAVARRVSTNPRFAALDQAVADQGWRIVVLTRLSPLFPFTFLNYAFGLTRVTLREYVLASWLGMMPGTVLYVYLGSLAEAAGSTRQRTPAEWAFYGGGLLATIAVTVIVTRLARRSLAQKLGG